jgi:hypothetical protein
MRRRPGKSRLRGDDGADDFSADLRRRGLRAKRDIRSAAERASNAFIGDTMAVGTITNERRRASLTINNVSVSEGNSGTTKAIFTVTPLRAIRGAGDGQVCHTGWDGEGRRK